MPKWLVALALSVGILVALAVVFGIAAPFIWEWVFNKAPSETMVAISSMLEVLAAILALGVAVGGGALMLSRIGIYKIALSIWRKPS